MGIINLNNLSHKILLNFQSWKMGCYGKRFWRFRGFAFTGFLIFMKPLTKLIALELEWFSLLITTFSYSMHSSFPRGTPSSQIPLSEGWYKGAGCSYSLPWLSRILNIDLRDIFVMASHDVVNHVECFVAWHFLGIASRIHSEWKFSEGF